MRKKSHISLANGLMKNFDSKLISKHKFTFCIASIWPDCRPSFITTPHRIDKTFSLVKRNIFKLVDNDKDFTTLTTANTAHIGVILHYVADYFTYPHNIEYTGTFKDHVYYEKDLKYKIKKYVTGNDVRELKNNATVLTTPDKLFEHISKAHSEYLKTIRSLEQDVKYITQICMDVFISIVAMLGIDISSINCASTI